MNKNEKEELYEIFIKFNNDISGLKMDHREYFITHYKTFTNNKLDTFAILHYDGYSKEEILEMPYENMITYCYLFI